MDDLVESVKSAMRTGRRPVAIASALDGDRPVGCAVSAFLCLSLSPPSLLVALRTGSGTLERIQRHRRFGLSLLGDRQQPLVRAFATGPCLDRFSTTPYELVEDVPLVGDCPAGLVCALATEVPLYDHTLLIGEVLTVRRPPAEVAA